MNQEAKEQMDKMKKEAADLKEAYQESTKEVGNLKADLKKIKKEKEEITKLRKEESKKWRNKYEIAIENAKKAMDELEHIKLNRKTTENEPTKNRIKPIGDSNLDLLCRSIKENLKEEDRKQNEIEERVWTPKIEDVTSWAQKELGRNEETNIIVMAGTNNIDQEEDENDIKSKSQL